MTDDFVERVIAAAARAILAGRRVELHQLADDLGVNRSTLHRRVGDRAAVVGEAMWLLTEAALRAASDEAERLGGTRPRTGLIADHYLDQVAGAHGLRRFLDEEPEFALRVLTAPDGRVQPRLISWVADSLRADVAAGRLRPVLPAPDLAYAVVRLGEVFVYADVVAARAPDVEAAKRLIAALIDGGSQ